MDEYKTCFTCKSNKSVSCFYADKIKNDGLSSDCKECKKARAKRWREANRDYHRQYSTQWQHDNPEQVYLKNRAFAEANPEKVRQYKKKWIKANPSYAKLKNLRRRASLNKASFFEVTPKDLAALMRRPCFYCGKKAEHIDHIIPLKRQGQHRLGNLAASCMSCNTSKNTKYVMEWKIWKKRLR